MRKSLATTYETPEVVDQYGVAFRSRDESKGGQPFEGNRIRPSSFVPWSHSEEAAKGRGNNTSSRSHKAALKERTKVQTVRPPVNLCAEGSR
uniref:Uncharacterized protein n=1 Tax=Steinernema glaseri TaxID=37863 RepID=A0A1I7YGW6_9BILA